MGTAKAPHLSPASHPEAVVLEMQRTVERPSGALLNAGEQYVMDAESAAPLLAETKGEDGKVVRAAAKVVRRTPLVPDKPFDKERWLAERRKALAAADVDAVPEQPAPAEAVGEGGE
jgi:hypothetical protein